MARQREVAGSSNSQPQQQQQQQQQRRHLWPQPSLLLMLLAVAACGQTVADASAQAAGDAHTALIVRFTPDDGLSTSSLPSTAAAAAVSPAAAADAASAAVAARGGDVTERERVASMAAAAATAAPRIAAVTATLTSTAESMGFRVVLSTPIATVFQGTVLTIAAAEGDVQTLKQRLQQRSDVEMVWFARTRKPPKHVEPKDPPANPRSSSSSIDGSTVTPEANAAAPAAATDGSVLTTGLSRLAAKYPNLDGNGTLICVIDTGLQYMLSAFGSCTGINTPAGQCRVVVGRDMVGSDYDGTPGSLPVEGDAPLDCYDHGTKVASVAATANGVAPGAMLGIYRIFGCRGVATDGVIIPAFDRAVRDGCHIINLSAADTAGYEERSPYRDVMQSAWDKGVLSVKSAGNSGTEGVFYEADVALAVGSITVGSIGADWFDVDEVMEVSQFSSFGPHPELSLSPHICAPGATIPAISRSGVKTRVSGTSFSCPYTSGVLALWRQGKQLQALTAKRSLKPSEVSQTAATKALVNTADMVRSLTRNVVEPVARCGGGIIQADALLENQISVEPMMLNLPSYLRRSWLGTIRLTWTGAAAVPANVTYEVKHVPAYSLNIVNNWYGTDLGNNRKDFMANVTILTPRIRFIAGTRPTLTVRVNFTLPPELQQQPLLYSGIIRLLPIIPAVGNSSRSSSNDSSSNSTEPPAPTRDPYASFVPLVIPYQGYSGIYSSVPIIAREMANSSDTSIRYYNSQLAANARALCYAPKTKPSSQGALMDYGRSLPWVCSGGFPKAFGSWVNVSLAVLQESPQCSLRVTLAPQLPVQWLHVDLHARNGTKIGALQSLDTSANGNLVSTNEIWSWCLGFNGNYTSTAGVQETLQVGTQYRLVAYAVGPVAVRDLVNKLSPRRERVNIKGVIHVIP